MGGEQEGVLSNPRYMTSLIYDIISAFIKYSTHHIVVFSIQ